MQLRWFHAVDFHLKPEGASREWVIEVNTDCVLIKSINHARQLSPSRIGKREHHANRQFSIVTKGMSRNILKIRFLRFAKPVFRRNSESCLIARFKPSRQASKAGSKDHHP